MHATLLGRQFQMNHWSAHANLAGLAHEESLVHPVDGGNCLNWVLGHVVATRNALLALLDQPPVWSEAEAQPYRRGSRPPLAAEQARPLEDIVVAFDASQSTVLARLAQLTDHDLARPGRDGQTLGEQIAGLSFHESYHLGQCGLLRRMLGKDGAIA
jgi:hypothetical protein